MYVNPSAEALILTGRARAIPNPARVVFGVARGARGAVAPAPVVAAALTAAAMSPAAYVCSCVKEVRVRCGGAVTFDFEVETSSKHPTIHQTFGRTWEKPLGRPCGHRNAPPASLVARRTPTPSRGD